MILMRRFVVLLAFAFWQGGFTFYAAVAAPVSSEVLGSSRERSLLSQRITRYLNLAGAIALVSFAWDAAAARDRATWRRWLRWIVLLALAFSLAALLWLQFHIESADVDDPYDILHLGDFPEDRWYLWI